MNNNLSSGGESGGREIPKSGPINRLKNQPKDSVPISKSPKRQRSSRFHVTERVELEKLPNLKGMKHIFYIISGFILESILFL